MKKITSSSRDVVVVIATIWVVIIAYFVPAALAQNNKPATALPGVEPKAIEVLRKMSATLAGARAFAFDSEECIDQIDTSGQKIQLSKSIRVLLGRPNHLTATIKGDAENLAYFYDGKQLTIVNHNDQVHAVQDVPDTIDAAFDFLAERFGITAPLSDLLFADPFQAMTTRVRSGRYVGLHQVGDTRCHHLAFRQDGIDWQIWVEDAERAVPRKVVITYKDQPGYPQFVAVLHNWDLAATPDEAAFKAVIPSGSKRVDLQPLQAEPPAGTADPSSGGGK